MEEAYKKLISSDLEQNAKNKRPKNFKLNIFVSKDQKYQNLLSAEYVPDELPKSKEVIRVMKIWEGIKTDEETPEVSFQLLKNGEEIGEPKKFEGTFVLFEIENKDELDQYTVKEVGENKNSIKIGNAWYKVTYEGDAQKGFVVKNKKLPPLTPMEPPTREVKVTKEWKDSYGNNLNEAPVDKIKVELYKDGVATGKKLELTKYNNWTG